jgi:F-type H+-transporting ATPase subunit gamma
MATLKEIRNQLHSVGNIQHITTTMEMVAAARLHKAQAKVKQAAVYASKMREILDKLSSAATDFSHPLLEKREVKKVGFVIVASDKGLCGPYNTNIFSAADKMIKKYQPENVELFLLGRKAVDYYRRKKLNIKKAITDKSGKFTFEEVKEFTQQIENSYLSKEVDEIHLVYTKFHSIVNREISIERFLPFGKPESQAKQPAILAKKNNEPPNGAKAYSPGEGDAPLGKRELAGIAAKQPSSDYLFEPSPEKIYAQILSQYCIIKIQTFLNEAYASELAARRFAMKAAAKNAEEMIESLTLIKNKIRQTGITKEMLEIIAGAEGVV